MVYFDIVSGCSMSYINKFKFSLNILFWIGIYPISIQNNIVITKPSYIVYQLSLLLLSTVCFTTTSYMFFIATDIYRSLPFLFGVYQSILFMAGSIATIFSCFLTRTNHLNFLNSLTVIDAKIMKEFNCSKIDSSIFYYKCFVKDVLLTFLCFIIVLVYFELNPNAIIHTWYEQLSNITVTFVSLNLIMHSLHIQNCAQLLINRNVIVRKHLQKFSDKNSIRFNAALNIANDLFHTKILFEKSFKLVIFLNISTNFINSTVLLYYMLTAFLYKFNGDNMFQNWQQYIWSIPLCFFPFTIKIILLVAALDNLSNEVGPK